MSAVQLCAAFNMVIAKKSFVFRALNNERAALYVERFSLPQINLNQYVVVSALN